MYYLLGELSPHSGLNYYIQIKTKDDQVLATSKSEWSSNIDLVLKSPVSDKVRPSNNWDNVSRLKKLFTVIASSPTKITARTHPELAI